MIALVYFNVSNAVGRGVGSIGSLLASEGYGFAFYNTLYHDLGFLRAKLIDHQYSVLMISVMTLGLDDVTSFVNDVRRYSDIPVMIGGIGPTSEPKRVLGAIPYPDIYVCVGEGEGPISEWLKALGDKDECRKVRGIGYRDDSGQAVINPTYPLESLDKLPRFVWEMFPRDVVCSNGASYVSATRGCPFACRYCANSVYLRLYGGKGYVRSRPVSQVIEEMEDLKQRFQTEFFYFSDEMALSDPLYAKQLFLTIADKLALPYGIMARPEALTPEMVTVLKDTGCQYLGIGVECGDEKFRRTYLNRNMSNDKIREAFRLTKEAGLFRASYNMLGFPVDNDDEITESTRQLNRELEPDYAQFTIFYPFPGTKLYTRCRDADLIDPERVKETRSYYQESCLRGKSVRPVADEMDKEFNPNGLTFRR